MGTMLIDSGLKPENCLETANIENPDLVTSLHRAYIETGADIIHTNTFGASSLRLARYKRDPQVREINSAAVEIARKAADGYNVYIAGTVGPCGEAPIPFGEINRHTLYSNFREQAEILIEGGVDIIAIETMTGIVEAVLGAKAIRDVAPDLPLFASLSFSLTPKGFYTGRGVNIETAADELRKAGVDVVGANCCQGFDFMLKIAREFKIFSHLPIIIQPNAGLPDLSDGRAVYPDSPELLATIVPQLIELGVSVIGGCCGTTPQHIEVIRKIIDNHPRPDKS